MSTMDENTESGRNASGLLGEELFGKPEGLKSGISTHEIDQAFADAALMGDLGNQVDPDVADEICAELVTAEDLEKIQP